jgi:hypothetical protein
MYVGRDFDPSDIGESERFTLDFVNDLQAGDSITGAVWSCEVAAKSALPDPGAASHVDGPAEFLGTKTSQRISGLVAGVIYALTATVTTANNDIVMLWSHVECKDPA